MTGWVAKEDNDTPNPSVHKTLGKLLRDYGHKPDPAKRRYRAYQVAIQTLQTHLLQQHEQLLPNLKKFSEEYNDKLGGLTVGMHLVASALWHKNVEQGNAYLKALDKLIGHYLFNTPARPTPQDIEAIKKFLEKTFELHYEVWTKQEKDAIAVIKKQRIEDAKNGLDILAQTYTGEIAYGTDAIVEQIQLILTDSNLRFNPQSKSGEALIDAMVKYIQWSHNESTGIVPSEQHQQIYQQLHQMELIEPGAISTAPQDAFDFFKEYVYFPTKKLMDEIEKGPGARPNV